MRSGYSKGAMELYYRPGDGAAFSGGIAVLAPYAVLIKGNPARQLVTLPVRQVTPRILEDFLRRLEVKGG